MEPQLHFFLNSYPIEDIIKHQRPKYNCLISPNATLFLCEMLDENVCKCFAFDSNDGLHWTALGLGATILAICIYAVIRYRRNQKKKRNGGHVSMLPMREIVQQCQ